MFTLGKWTFFLNKHCNKICSCPDPGCRGHKWRSTKSPFCSHSAAFLYFLVIWRILKTWVPGEDLKWNLFAAYSCIVFHNTKICSRQGKNILLPPRPCKEECPRKPPQNDVSKLEGFFIKLRVGCLIIKSISSKW